MEVGSDVNYGSITKQLVNHLNQNPNFKLQTSTEVTGISQNDDKTWTVSFKNLKTGKTDHVKTRFVFIGAGGAAVKLLQLTGLPEAKQYAGFPVGGEFLITDNPAITAQHTAKVYGRAELGAPQCLYHILIHVISTVKICIVWTICNVFKQVPKNGSQLDLLASTNKSNVLPMTTVGLENLDLVKYL